VLNPSFGIFWGDRTLRIYFRSLSDVKSSLAWSEYLIDVLVGENTTFMPSKIDHSRRHFRDIQRGDSSQSPSAHKELYASAVERGSLDVTSISATGSCGAGCGPPSPNF